MKSIVHRIPLTRARINLGQLVRRVHVNREYFILEKEHSRGGHHECG